MDRKPFADDTFDLVTAVETHFFWPDLPADVKEVRRVLKEGGTFLLVAEVYRGGRRLSKAQTEKLIDLTGVRLLTAEEHRELLLAGGYSEVQVRAEPGRGWICALGRKV